MTIRHERVSGFPRGTLAALLRDAYSFNAEYERRFLADWLEFDDFFFDNPRIADKYGMITTLDGEAAGLVSWDPRNQPEYAVMGHNCVKTAFKGRGIGKAQMAEAVRRILADGARRVIVTTNSDLVPAQRTYEGAGFRLLRERPNEEPDAFFRAYLDYELIAPAR